MTTTHAVLAGAYKGRDLDERVTHTHASRDRGDTALCNKRLNLCDVVEPGEPTCPTCRKRLKLGPDDSSALLLCECGRPLERDGDHDGRWHCRDCDHPHGP